MRWRKLVPALYNLFVDRRTPERFAIVGVARRAMDDEAFRLRMREGVDRFSRRGKAEETTWERFAPLLSYVSEDISVSDGGHALRGRLE